MRQASGSTDRTIERHRSHREHFSLLLANHARPPARAPAQLVVAARSQRFARRPVRRGGRLRRPHLVQHAALGAGAQLDRPAHRAVDGQLRQARAREPTHARLLDQQLPRSTRPVERIHRGRTVRHHHKSHHLILGWPHARVSSVCQAARRVLRRAGGRWRPPITLTHRRRHLIFSVVATSCRLLVAGHRGRRARRTRDLPVARLPVQSAQHRVQPEPGAARLDCRVHGRARLCGDTRRRRLVPGRLLGALVRLRRAQPRADTTSRLRLYCTFVVISGIFLLPFECFFFSLFFCSCCQKIKCETNKTNWVKFIYFVFVAII